MAPADPAATLRIGVAYSPRAGVVDEVTVLLPPGSTVLDAITASGLQARHRRTDLATLACGVWGAPRQPSDALRDLDRVELYRPLQADPKEARRQRHATQAKRQRTALGRR
jgi:uncharacterized protein